MSNDDQSVAVQEVESVRWVRTFAAVVYTTAIAAFVFTPIIFFAAAVADQPWATGPLLFLSMAVMALLSATAAASAMLVQYIRVLIEVMAHESR